MKLLPDQNYTAIIVLQRIIIFQTKRTKLNIPPCIFSDLRKVYYTGPRAKELLPVRFLTLLSRPTSFSDTEPQSSEWHPMYFLGWVTANARMHSRCARLSASRVGYNDTQSTEEWDRRVCCAHQDTRPAKKRCMPCGFLWN